LHNNIDRLGAALASLQERQHVFRTQCHPLQVRQTTVTCATLTFQ